MMQKEFFIRFGSAVLLLPLVFFFILQGGNLFIFFLIICLIISIYEWNKITNNNYLFFAGAIFLFFSFYTAQIIRNDSNIFSLFNFFFLITICISTDIGGYVFGKVFKGPKLTKISPKKTYSGVFGSYFFSLLSTYILFKNQNYFFDNFLHFKDINLFLVIAISSISQLGDLFISYFKRLTNIKDTGKIIPGHGGLLDRIDGMIFVFPLSLIFNLFP